MAAEIRPQVSQQLGRTLEEPGSGDWDGLSGGRVPVDSFFNRMVGGPQKRTAHFRYLRGFPCG